MRNALNDQGVFWLDWTDPHWQPQRGDQVLVRGALFSVISHHSHSARIDAAEINSLIEKFIQLGILREITGQARNRIFRADEILRVIEGAGQNH